jgi:hypothetical protein
MHGGHRSCAIEGMAKRVAILLAICLTTPLLAQNRREENIVLDAAEKHIVRENYHNDEAVTLSGDRWRLYAGASIDAQRVDLRMRNVRGVVRFRADWSRVANILDRSGKKP